MGLQIFMRTDANTSYFQRYLLKLIACPNSDKLLLCSGYIWEGQKYSVLDDKLLEAISANNLEVVTVAGKLFGYWTRMYRMFVRKLNENGINVMSYIARKSNWHAKVAIVLSGEDPIAGIVGSSNLTGPAYREPFPMFNYEADVLIWRNGPTYDKYFRKDMVTDLDSPFDPIDSVLNPDVEQPDEGARLKALYHRTMNLEDLLQFENE